jgi:ribonuclease BN (tRNA processing enzyme)
LSHPNGGSGYKFTEDEKSFVFLTDNELGYVHPGGCESEEYMKFSTGADLLIHDGEFTPAEYETQVEWGHSTYVDALELAIEADVKQLGLFHHNQDRFDPEMDTIVEDCDRRIAEKNETLKCFAVSSDMAFML